MFLNTALVPRRKLVLRLQNIDTKPTPAERIESHRVLNWSQLPAWQQDDNSFVETGYRIATPSVLECLKSWRYLHNESVNIFSHLIGAILFFALPFILYSELRSRYDSASAGDKLVFAFYSFGVAVCFTVSVAFHTLMSHSARGCAFGVQLDFQGVIVLMWSAAAPMVYYTFYLERILQIIYWSLTSCFAMLASVMTFTPAFRKAAAKPLRASVFGALALSTLTVVIHGLIAHGWNGQSHRFPMWGIGLTMLCNTIAAGVYVLRFPEKWWRRKFDIFGASHQLMHCIFVFSGLAFLAGMITAFDNAHSGIILE